MHVFLILSATIGEKLFGPYFSTKELDILDFFGVVGIVVLPVLLAIYTRELFWKIAVWKRYGEVMRLRGEAGVNIPGRSFNPELGFRPEEAEVFSGSPGNFLSIAYSVENLLRLIASKIFSQDIPFASEEDKIVRIVVEKKVLTESGLEKIKMIRWMKEMVIQGKSRVISPKVLGLSISLAWGFHRELNEWLLEAEKNR